MTIRHRLLTSSALAIFIFSGSVLAESFCPKSFDVLERGDGDKYSFVKRELENLYCQDTFEGKYFKIVQGTDDKAISIHNADEQLIRKAANVYHHLTIAQKFWVSEIKSDYVSSLPQITIRLEITNAFSNTRHFKNAEQEKNYNNAWSIPEGQTPDFALKSETWGKEIWFSPMKRIESRKEVKSKGENPVHQSLVLVKDPIIQNNVNALIYQSLALSIAPEINQSLLLDSALQRLGAVALMYGLIETSKHMDKWFVEKYYYVETAMIPEIIYHEYAHIAMSDTMKTVHSVPVIEGMADYFAARISTRSKMYSGIKGFSNNRAKDTKSKSLYHPYLEGAWNATSDYTLSLLWLGKTEFDKQNEERLKKGQDIIANYDKLVHDAHLNMNEESTIMNGLTRALVRACEASCQNTRAGINTLNMVFENKGI